MWTSRSGVCYCSLVSVKLLTSLANTNSFPIRIVKQVRSLSQLLFVLSLETRRGSEGLELNDLIVRFEIITAMKIFVAVWDVGCRSATLKD